MPNSSAVVGHLIRAKPKFTVTCHHYHPTMPSRIPSKSRKKGQWIKDVKGTTQGIPGIQVQSLSSRHQPLCSPSQALPPAGYQGWMARLRFQPLRKHPKYLGISKKYTEINMSVRISIPTSPIISVLEVGFLHLSKLKAKVVRRHGFSRPFRIP